MGINSSFGRKKEILAQVRKFVRASIFWERKKKKNGRPAWHFPESFFPYCGFQKVGPRSHLVRPKVGVQRVLTFGRKHRRNAERCRKGRGCRKCRRPEAKRGRRHGQPDKPNHRPRGRAKRWPKPDRRSVADRLRNGREALNQTRRRHRCGAA